MLSASTALHPKRHSIGSGQAPELLAVGLQAVLTEFPYEALRATRQGTFRKPLSTAPAISRLRWRRRVVRAHGKAELLRKLFISPSVSFPAVRLSLPSGGVTLAAAGFTRAALVPTPRGELTVTTHTYPPSTIGAVRQLADLAARLARPVRRGHRGAVPHRVAARRKSARWPARRQSEPGLGHAWRYSDRTGRRLRGQCRRRNASCSAARARRHRTRTRSG